LVFQQTLLLQRRHKEPEVVFTLLFLRELVNDVGNQLEVDRRHSKLFRKEVAQVVAVRAHLQLCRLQNDDPIRLSLLQVDGLHPVDGQDPDVRTESRNMFVLDGHPFLQIVCFELLNERACDLQTVFCVGNLLSFN